MKIALVNTYDAQGGAAIAARRLHFALQSAGVDSNWLVMEKKKTTEATAVANSWWAKKMAFARFAFEALQRKPILNDQGDLFAFTLGKYGTDISRHPLIQQADIIHLHWINHGFLSLQQLDKLAALGKPIVWTQHDMWAFTGGCHYSRGCLRYTDSCGQCPYLKGNNAHDASYRALQKKLQYIKKGQFHLVTCSRWLGDMAKKSALAQWADITPVPNPIDTSIFKPADKKALKKKLGIDPAKKVLLFGAANTSDPRKGFHLLKAALQELPADDDIQILLFGKSNQEALNDIPFPITNVGLLSDVQQIVECYAAADVFVLPSLEDNLPNTVMEAMACGTPVVGFDIGGVPEMVAHQRTGYVAEPGNTADLAKGIASITGNDEYRRQLSENARQKVLNEYSFKAVSDRYLSVYRAALNPSS